MGESFVSYSTNGIAPHRQVDVWNERVSGAITHLQVEPACSGVFDAHFKAAEFAGINFVEVVCSPTRVVHTQACARRIQDPAYLIQLQRAGNCVHRSASSEMRISPGTLLCDTSYEQLLEASQPPFCGYRRRHCDTCRPPDVRIGRFRAGRHRRNRVKFINLFSGTVRTADTMAGQGRGLDLRPAAHPS
jgi:hypothetical protein